MLELTQFAKHHIPEEPELTMRTLPTKESGVLPIALVSLSETEGHNIRELEPISRYIITMEYVQV